MKALKPAAVVLFVSLLLAARAVAGPPFITDDPQPTDPGRWEIYSFATGSHVPGDTAGEAGLDFNYGGARDLQLTAVIPAAFESHGRTTWGLGDVELAAKYRFLHQKGPAGLDVAVFPRLFLPTATSRHGDRRASLLLPVWAQKDVAGWSVFGGGGYTINPGPVGRDYWQVGLAVTRPVSEKLTLGAEAFHREADTEGGRAATTLNLGALMKLAGPWSLLVAGGPGVQNARREGQYNVYAALKADF